jgi:hypothetical protein
MWICAEGVSSGSKKSKADPSIQKKKEAVKRTQARRMFEPGHKCSKEVTVLQKRAENHHCDTKDLKELLTKMLTMSRRKRSKPS